jgi:hypothetical protein
MDSPSSSLKQRNDSQHHLSSRLITQNKSHHIISIVSTFNFTQHFILFSTHIQYAYTSDQHQAGPSTRNSTRSMKLRPVDLTIHGKTTRLYALYRGGRWVWYATRPPSSFHFDPFTPFRLPSSIPLRPSLNHSPPVRNLTHSCS